MKRLLFGLLGFIFLPQLAAAQVSISEIMYDPAGNDSGREWVEICADTAMDLTGWKFFENGSNHGLADFRGGLNLAGGNCAVIVSDPNAFLADFPNYSGTIFDSSWSSFNNSAGEELAIKDDALNIVDSVIYNVGLGAAGDGNSLQKINGAWSAAAPTPGMSASGSDASQTVDAAALALESGSVWPEYVPPESAPKIKVEIVAEPRAIAGAAQKFEARVFGTKNEPITNARVIWNFGDGERGEGRFAAHTFGYPGTYLVVMDAASGEYAVSSRFPVIVESNTLYISELSPGAATTAWIEIVNPGANTADLSGWFLESAGGNFIFPDNSILMPRSFTVFASESTKLNVWPAGKVKLLYPNGKTADTFIYSGELGAGGTFQRANGKTIVLKASPGFAMEVQQSAARPEPPVFKADVAPVSENKDEGGGNDRLAAVAAAAEAESESGSKWWLWLAASTVLGIFGAAAFLLMKNQAQKEVTTISKEADEFEIEEEKDGK